MIPKSGHRFSDKIMRTKTSPKESLMTDTLEPMRKRLSYRAHHRGTKEMDLVFGAFADARLAGFDKDDLARFEAALEEPDADVLGWVTGQAPVPADQAGGMIAVIVGFAQAGLKR
jgi:antitoxin CptB